MRIAELELDLEVFAGPFDLLMALVLREEIDLREVDLAQVVLAYVEHLDAAGELDLESATEFLVLIAALLELKSRLMLPRDDADESLELGPQEAAEELLARMLEYRRYAAAAARLHQLHAAQAGYHYRSAPLPANLRRLSLEAATAAYEPQILAAAIGELLRPPPPLQIGHIRPTVSLERRLAHLRDLLAQSGGSFDFEQAVAGADRITQAVTLFALLELYKKGEASWKQAEPFGPILVEAR